MLKATLIFTISCTAIISHSQLTYPIVDTDVNDHYDNTSIIAAPSSGQAFYGQDASYDGFQPSYTDNGDGTVTDNVTGLTWEQDMGTKISYADAVIKAQNSTLGGHTDWRIPTIKELVSLTYFSGRCFGNDVVDKFIDTNYFIQPIGDTSIGEREIDAQTWSKTHYTSLTMFGDSTLFGMNFADGRLKGYPKYEPQDGVTPRTMYFRLVRGNTSYGINNFVDNGDGTITDAATGLMWQQADDGNTRDWEDALAYSEDLSLAGHSDWRLPNAKELHSIVDYTRSPDATSSPAIDPLFSCTEINDPEGNPGQYGYYWSSSPLLDGPSPYGSSVYICFGEAQGQMESPPGSGTMVLTDVHGAGAMRNDPKTGLPANYPSYNGPQNDVQYVFNFVRCVRTDASAGVGENSMDFNIYPNPVSEECSIRANEIPKTIQVLNLRGNILCQTKPTKTLTTLNLAHLSAGVYFVKLESAIGKQVIKKFIKTP